MADDDGELDLDELKRQTQSGDRLDAQADNDAQQELKAAILDELKRIDAGDEQKTVSIWDGPVAAYVRALDEHPEQRAEVGDALRRQLDVDAEDEIDRSELVRYAIRLGFRQAAPDKFETLKESVQEHATEGL